jgi:hypothetical protein
MASYPPPTETLPIFDAGVFTTNDSTLTISQADARYLKFPTGQGTETLSALVVSGGITLGSNNIKLSAESNYYFNNISNVSTAGGNNCMVGLNCGSAITTGGTNTGLGYFDNLKTLTTGNSNTAVGFQSLKVVNTTNNNTALGYSSGQSTTGSNNTFIGSGADTSSASASNSTAIGYGATITASNQVVLGTSTEVVVIPNQIGFSYTTLPTFVSSSIGYTQSFTLANLANGTGVRNTTNTSIALPVGVYMCTLFYQIDITFGSTTRTIIEFLVASNATLVNQAKLGFVYAPAVQEYNYYSFPAILKVTTNPCSVYSQLTSNGNCNITSAVLSVVRIA